MSSPKRYLVWDREGNFQGVHGRFASGADEMWAKRHVQKGGSCVPEQEARLAPKAWEALRSFVAWVDRNEHHSQSYMPGFKELVASARAALDAEPDRHRPCGCVECICDDEERCHGCGARSCEDHAVYVLGRPDYAAPEAVQDAREWIDSLAQVKAERDGLHDTVSEASSIIGTDSEHGLEDCLQAVADAAKKYRWAPQGQPLWQWLLWCISYLSVTEGEKLVLRTARERDLLSAFCAGQANASTDDAPCFQDWIAQRRQRQEVER